MSSNSGNLVGDLSYAASSSTQSTVTYKPKSHRMAGGHPLSKRLFLQGQRWTDILESRERILVGRNTLIILSPPVLKRQKRTWKMNIFTIFKPIMISSTLYYRGKCFHSFKRNESPHNINIALCIVSGEFVYANCDPSCAAGKSRFCNHVLALMLKVCKYTLYNCKNVTELQHEADENSSTACTSTLQRWHQPRVEGISSYPIMMKLLFPKHDYRPRPKVLGLCVTSMKQERLTGKLN